MKYILPVLFLIALTGSSCKKGATAGQCDTYFTITSTVTDRITNLASGITSDVSSYGNDLCYSYKGMEISQQATPSGPVYQFEYFLRAKGVRTCGEDVVCAQALYQVRDTIKIKPTSTGTYYLNFYNEGLLFRRDTVMVN